MSKCSNTWRRSLALCAALVLAASGALLAQNPTGNLYGTVTDTDGKPLPGVTVQLTGPGAPQILTTDSLGRFRFLSLDPGAYDLNASLQGFSTINYPNIDIAAGRNTTIEVKMSPAVEETITVVSESPLLDERKLTTGTRITRQELEKIPSSRDPWGILTQAGGVQTDRVNVGGNESGQQSVFLGKGTTSSENDFLVDGVEITDMSAIGSSPTYYDFDQFEQVSVSTGGNDITKNTAGVSLNLVTKRGTNDFSGSGRYYLTDGQWQDKANISSSKFAPGQSAISLNGINEVLDFGFEAGGPVWKDHLWAWGSWGRNDIKNIVAGGTPDNTLLENQAGKLNAQIVESNSFVGSWNRGDKIKNGRGAGPDRQAETTWDQSGPTQIFKYEDTHIFTPNLFVTGMYNHVEGGFGLTAKAGTGPNAAETLQDSDGVWKNGFESGFTTRPAKEWHADASYFFNTGNVGHELKFGGRYRTFDRSSPFAWPGRNIVHIAGENFGADPGPTDYFFLYRESGAPLQQFYRSGWVQDTITMGSWTINAGLRYDRQTGANKASKVEGSPALPNDLPSINFTGNNAGGFSWESISPRVGVTYALGEQKKTLLRASLSRFPDQLSSAYIAHTNPLGAAYAYYVFTDQNGNNMWDGPQEPHQFLFASGFDPNDPASTVSPNKTDPNLDPPLTDELVLGVEHSFLPQFVVGLDVTYRNIHDIVDGFAGDGTNFNIFENRFVRPVGSSGTGRLQNRSDFVFEGNVTATLPNGKVVTVPTYALNPNLEYTGGTLLSNGNREINYYGASINFTKRLANHWMGRGYFTYNTAEWKISASDLAHFDPNDQQGSFDNNGDQAAEESGGSGNKGDVWLNSKWAFDLNGLYQVAPDKPWGFNIAANIFGRQGYPLPYFVSVTGSDGVSRNIQVTDSVDSFRLDDIYTVDARIEKEFSATDNFSLTVSLDGFNLLDRRYVLQREAQLDGSRPDFLEETLSPRIFRAGVRLEFH